MHKNIISYIQSQTWAIEPSAFRLIQSILTSKEETDHDLVEEFKTLNKETNGIKYALCSEDGTPKSFVQEDALQQFRTGDPTVLVIPVFGSLFKKANVLQQISGAQSMQMIESYIEKANEEESVKGIVLHIDSPGGTVDGTESLGNMIAKSKKPIVAYTDGMIASGAYWIASQTRKILMNGKTSMLGSIGTMLVHESIYGWLQQNGVEVNYITATKSFNKVYAPETAELTEERRAKVLSILDPLNSVFLANVKKGRGEKIVAEEDTEVFTGKMFVGQQAIKVGLADGYGTLRSSIQEVVKMAKNESQIKSDITMKTEEKKIQGDTKSEVAETIVVEETDDKKETTEVIEDDKKEIVEDDKKETVETEEKETVEDDKKEVVEEDKKEEVVEEDKKEDVVEDDKKDEKVEEATDDKEDAKKDEVEKIDEVEQKADDKKEEVVEVEVDVVALAKTVSGLTKTVAENTDEIENLKVENEQLKKENKTLSNSNAKLKEANKILAEATGKPIVADDTKEGESEEGSPDWLNSETMPEDKRQRVIWVQHRAKNILANSANLHEPSRKSAN